MVWNNMCAQLATRVGQYGPNYFKVGILPSQSQPYAGRYTRDHPHHAASVDDEREQRSSNHHDHEAYENCYNSNQEADSSGDQEDNFACTRNHLNPFNSVKSN